MLRTHVHAGPGDAPAAMVSSGSAYTRHRAPSPALP